MRKYLYRSIKVVDNPKNQQKNTTGKRRENEKRRGKRRTIEKAKRTLKEIK